jgi:hypothetical protein
MGEPCPKPQFRLGLEPKNVAAAKDSKALGTLPLTR